MPVNRSYGYSGYGGTYSNYTPGMYTSSFATTYGNRAGSSSPATLRSTTPSRGFGSNSLINTSIAEDRATSSPATYKYLSSRQDYFSPSAYSRMYSSDLEKRDLITIKTEEINTSGKKENSRDYAIPGEITRDTTLNIRGGKPVVRMVTQKAKESPYLNNTGWRARMKDEDESQNMTLGQRLAMKHQIVDKPKVKEKTPPHHKKGDNHKHDSGEESEWTWETCSSSEAEDYSPKKTKKKTPTPPRRKTPPKQRNNTPPPPEPPKRAPVAYTKSNTTTLCSTDDKTSIKQTAPPTPNSAIRNKWLDAMYNEPKPKPQTNTTRIPNFGKAVAMNKSLIDTKLTKEQEKSTTPIRTSSTISTSTSRPISWAGSRAAIQDVQCNIHTDNKFSGEKNTTNCVTENKSKQPPSVSSGSSSSPPLYKYNPRKPQKYQGAGSQLFDSSDEDSPKVNVGWRPGQPPRGDCVVKLTGNKSKTVIDSEHSKITNKVLTSDTEITSTISSKVSTAMQDKYSIPGLFIKPSTKAAPKSVKPVEAKLTLSPIEGTISLSTKVVEEKNSYQSSIFVPSKSPMLEARMQHSSTPSVKSIGVTSPSLKHKQNNEVPISTSEAPINNINLRSVNEKEAKSEEDSEWEYYTETEPSDTEEATKDTPLTLPPAETQLKTANPVQSTELKKVETKSATNSSNIPSVNMTDEKPKFTTPTIRKEQVQPKVVPTPTVKKVQVEPKVVPTPTVKKEQVEPKVVPTPTVKKEQVKPKVVPVKHTVDITIVPTLESKKVTKSNLDVNTNIASVKSVVVPPEPIKITVKDVPKKSEVIDKTYKLASKLNQKPDEQSQTKAQPSGVKQEKEKPDTKATQHMTSDLNVKPSKSNIKNESKQNTKEKIQPKPNNQEAKKITATPKETLQTSNDIPIKRNLKPKSPGEATPMSDKLTKKGEMKIPKTDIITQAKESKPSETIEKKPQPNAAVIVKTETVDKVKPAVQKQKDIPETKPLMQKEKPELTAQKQKDKPETTNQRQKDKPETITQKQKEKPDMTAQNQVEPIGKTSQLVKKTESKEDKKSRRNKCKTIVCTSSERK